MGRYCIPKEPSNRALVLEELGSFRNQVRRISADLFLVMNFCRLQVLGHRWNRCGGMHPPFLHFHRTGYMQMHRNGAHMGRHLWVSGRIWSVRLAVLPWGCSCQKISLHRWIRSKHLWWDTGGLLLDPDDCDRIPRDTVRLHHFVAVSAHQPWNTTHQEGTAYHRSALTNSPIPVPGGIRWTNHMFPSVLADY